MIRRDSPSGSGSERPKSSFSHNVYPSMTITAQAPRTKAILLVDDDDLVRKSISRMLSAENYRVLEASDAGQALEIWQLYKEEIEVLMTDIQMPGMNGIELVNHLATTHRKLKALYMSGYPEVLADQPVGARPVPFLQKPFTGKEASKTLRAILNRPLHGWKCPRCESGRYHGLSADCDGKTLTLIFYCEQCNLKRFSMLELTYPLERCPFCAGAVLLSGHSYIGKDEFSLGHTCYFCKAAIRISTPGCHVMAG